MGAQPPVTVASVAGWDRRYVPVALLYAGCSLRLRTRTAEAVAAILGHRGPTMVLKVYGKHIEQREEHLRECIAKGTKNYRSA